MKNTEQYGKQKLPIFAYLRRSTNKEEQKESLIQQEDGIFSILKKLNIKKEDVRFFAETYSGFENKKRKEWKKMIDEINELRTPCIILARDISRLSRNPTDTQVMMDLLYGDNGKKTLIDKIYYLEYDSIKEVSKLSDKEEVHKGFSASYYSSLTTKKFSVGGIMLKLENGQFPYKAPKGLDNFVIEGRRILRQNDKMRYILKAFQMKAEGKTLKEISKYLKQFGEINISPRHITDRLFKNTIYIGQYTEKVNLVFYDNLEFFEKVPPVPTSLWNRAFANLGKKQSKYGLKQEGDILGEKLKTAQGRTMTKYTPKGYTQYANTIEKLYISELAVLRGYAEHIKKLIDKIMFTYFLTVKENALIETKNIIINDEEAYAYGKAGLDLAGIKPENFPLFQENHPSYEGMDKNVRNRKIQELKDKFYTEVGRGQLLLERYLDNNGFTDDAPFTFMEMLQDASFDTIAFITLRENSEEVLEYKELHQREIKKLEERKKELEGERLGFIRLLERGKIEDSDYDKLIDENKRSIDLIIEKIEEFKKGSEKEELITRLPEILAKTFELNTKVHRNQQISEMKDDLLKLLQITTFELTVDNQKELKVKLFEVLDRISLNENGYMEPPSGLEPETSSLPMKCSTTELWRQIFTFYS